MFYLADSIHLILILPSGELTFCHGKIHHAINGKIHYFDWAIFNSKLLVHQRVFGPDQYIQSHVWYLGLGKRLRK